MTAVGEHPKLNRQIPGWFARLMTFAGRTAYWLGWPGIHLILTGSKRTRLVVLADNGKCLLVQQYLGSGAWKLPGGGVRTNETLAAAASRELFEELGIRAAPNDFVHVADAGMNENGHRYHAHFLAVHVQTPEALTLQRWEISDALWVSLEVALEEQIPPSVQQAVQVWAKQ